MEKIKTNGARTEVMSGTAQDNNDMDIRKSLIMILWVKMLRIL